MELIHCIGIKDYPRKSEGKIIKTICALAQALDMEIICEGVTNKKQIDFLDTMVIFITSKGVTST